MSGDITPGLIDAIPASDLPENGRSQSPAAARARRYRERQKQARANATVKGTDSKPRKTSQRSRAPRSLYPEIAATLTMANIIVTLSPLGTRPPSETLPEGRVGDELDDAEITLLARAIDSQAQRSPRFRKQVERILGASAGGQIVTVLGMIAMRRASRHGMLPDSGMVDVALGGMMQGGDLAALASFMPAGGNVDQSPHPETGEQAPVPTPDMDDDDAGVPSGFDAL